MNSHAGSRPGARVVLVLVLALLSACRGTYPERRSIVPRDVSESASRGADARRVDRVLARLLPFVPPGTCRRFGIIPSAVPNASVDAHGTLKLTAGLLAFSNTDDLLAFALAHELGHAVRRHPQRHRRNLWLQAIVTGAAVWAAHEWGASRSGAALAGAGVFFSTSLGGILPAMRRMETEADQLGKDILIRAGYRPSAGEEFWRRYARARPDRPRLPWLSPHPPDEVRARALAP
jgi:predicted Zn-dependent protease